MDRYIGQLLDNRYEILERIGIGGMAVVYKARCHRLNRLVAVKILKDDLAQDADFRRRFHEESQAVAMLSHPNIVAVYDVSRSAEVDYIVMELIDGITLKQYMQKKEDEKLTWREALHFSTQIMKALSHAHGRGIIHRDIKPHNIMVLRDGSVKVADFGIARLTSATQATLTQEALGSVHYISPEQARGSHIDARSDIYSAGVVLYEMVTGRLPYEGDSPVSVAIQHINSIPLSPRERDPEIPEALEAIIMKAMASNVDNRYVSADAMMADLEEFRKNPNINFEYTAADLLVGEGDEPTQVLGANTPHNVKPQRAHPEETAAQRRKHQAARRDEEEYDEYGDHKGEASRLPIFLAIGAIVLFLVAIGAFLWFSVFSGILSGDAGHNVPDLSGMTIEEARVQQEVKDYQFIIAAGETVASTLPEGQIVSHTPEGGMNAKTGTTITVQLSGGDGTDQPIAGDVMPDLANKDKRVAISLLKNVGIDESKIKLETIESDTITVDYVVSQIPAKDSALSGVTEVTLVVSLGPKVEKVTVISYLDMTEEEAKTKAIDDQKLKPVFAGEEYSATIAAGKVCAQSIPVASAVPEGSTITFKLSKGPNPSGTEDPPASPSPGVSTPPTTPPSPPPSQSPGVVPVYRTVQVELPDDDRASVTVRIAVGDDSSAYNKVLETKLRSIPASVKGNGVQTVTVYIDEVATQTFSLDFGA